MTSTCRHCGREITYRYVAHVGAAWTHTSTRTIYCHRVELVHERESTVASPILVDADTGERL